MALLGAVAALGSSLTWAFASVRYSQVSRQVGSLRVNLARALVVGPFYLLVATIVHRGHVTSGVTAQGALWLAISVGCSYALADSLFFSAARSVGVATALSIASTYPLWAVVVGVVGRGEAFGVQRGAGTLLCVSGVIILVRLAPNRPGSPTRSLNYGGLILAFITSLLWAGNSTAVKLGSPGLDVAQVNGLRYSFGLAVLSLAAGLRRLPLVPSRNIWRALLPAVLADGIIGSSLYVYGMGNSDLTIGATLSSLAPLISVPIAIASGEEQWNGARISAVMITVIGAVVLVSAA
jgi:drug/metabolite transporter (DMT)-like permease